MSREKHFWVVANGCSADWTGPFATQTLADAKAAELTRKNPLVTWFVARPVAKFEHQVKITEMKP